MGELYNASPRGDVSFLMSNIGHDDKIMAGYLITETCIM